MKTVIDVITPLPEALLNKALKALKEPIFVPSFLTNFPMKSELLAKRLPKTNSI
jgi:spore germination protein GerM